MEENFQIKELGNRILEGKKHRRQSSIDKEFIGDHLSLEGAPELEQFLSPTLDAAILFTDKINRLTDRNHMAESILVVTQDFMFIINSKLNKLDTRQPIPIASIEKIATSKQTDNAIVVFLPDFQTELLMTPYKCELIGLLSSRYHEIHNRELQIEFSDEIEFPVNAETIFEFDFVRSTSGVAMTLFCKASER